MDKIGRFKRINIVLLAIIFMIPIFSMNGMAKSAKSVKPVKVGKPVVTTVATDNGNIKLSWKAVKGSGKTKYEIYRADSKKGKYAKIKTTSKCTYIDRGRTAGKTVFYKVRAYRVIKKKKVTGSFSTVKKATPKVTVNPKPMTYVNEMPVGTAVPFTVGVSVNKHSSDGKYNSDAAIARSYAELKEIYGCDDPNGYNYIKKYNKDFFKENAVIVLFLTYGSGSIRQRFDSLVKNGNELCIGMTTIQPEVGTCDMAYWRITLEVKKSDISGVDKINCFNQNESKVPVEPAVPEPMTYVDEMPAGTTVPFTVGVSANTHCSEDKYNSDAAIARSYTELKEIYDCDYNPNGYNYIEKYNEDFFKENAVIVVFLTYGSGSVRQRFDSLVKNGNELCIGMTTIEPEVGTCDMAYWRITLEVKKSDIIDVDKINCFNQTECI